MGAETIPDIHRRHARAIQYVTYYEAAPGTAFLHDVPDAERVVFSHRRRLLESVFDPEHEYVLCPNSRELLRRIAAQLASTLSQGYDGVFIDKAFQPPASSLICDSHHDHVQPGRTGMDAFLHLLAGLDRQRRSRPDFLLIVNMSNPSFADTMRSGKLDVWKLADYVVWESFGFSSEPAGRHEV